MLAATDLPTPDERREAVARVPWVADARRVAGLAFGIVRNDTADLIDLAVGTVHARAAVVSLQEAADGLFQVANDVVEARLTRSVLARTDPIIDPVGVGEQLHGGENPDR